MKENSKILFDERGITPGSTYQKGQWKKIAIHDKENICGFFGRYRFLSNFWPAKIFLDNEEYSSVENAYQAAKYKKERRDFLKTCSPKEAIVFSKNNPLNKIEQAKWKKRRLKIMEKLLKQKFDKKLNPENHKKLLLTKNKHLEESNYWGDVYWGVHKQNKNEPGYGKNTLGKLLMKIRQHIRKPK